MDELLKVLLSSPESISGLVDQYKPTFYALCKSLFTVYKDLINNDELFEANAQYYKKQIDAYRAAGFSRSEAFELLTNEKEATRRSLQKSLTNK